MFIIDFLSKLPIAIYRNFKYPSKEAKVFGTYLYEGLAGRGKTYSLVKDAIDLKRKLGDDLFIVSNINIVYKGVNIVDKRLEKVSDITTRRDKNCLVIIDECPFYFSSKNWANFPLLPTLTTMRKYKGITIFASTQRNYLVDKSFRTLCDGIIQCKTYFGNLTVNEYFSPFSLDNDTGEPLQGKEPYKRVCFLQDNDIRDSYDSFDSVQDIEFDVKPSK